MELIHQLGYVEVVETEEGSDTDKEFVQEVKKSMQDVALHQSGKKKLKTARQLLDEV